MILSNASIRRPIAMGCLLIAFALLGLNSWRKMGLELMPRLDAPYITIVTIYPGATPSEIETDVAKRIEDAVVSIDGLKHVTSSCMQNACMTLIEFHLEVDVDIAATDVRERLDLIRADFPDAVEDPQIQKFDINARPVVFLALTGDATLDALYDYADNALKDKLTVISGVASVELVGGAKREVVVELDREKLAAKGLSSMRVVQAIAANVATIPSGNVREGTREYTVKFDADYTDLADIGTLEVTGGAGGRCLISDIGRVVMSTGEVRQTARVDGRECVAVRVVKKADANTVEVAGRVREAVDGIQAELPGGMELVYVSDEGRFIEATNESAWINVGQGIVLTALILLVFLHNVRALFVVCITMPLTVVIGLFFMHAAGFTLNSSTLIAIGMSVGILVTNSIVVLEAIVKRFEETGDARQAGRLGAAEVFIAVLASAGTNLVVLFPLTTMTSMVGMFIRPLALTMLIMTLASLFISFTLTPLLCSIVLKRRDAGRKGLFAGFERTWNGAFERLTSLLRRILAFNERHRWAALLSLAAVAAMFASSLRAASSIGSTMIKQPDQGQIYVKMEFPTSYSLPATTARVAAAEARLADLQELRHTLTTVGKVEGIIGQSSEGVYLAQILLRFSNRDERELTIDEILEDVRERMVGFPGAIVTATVPDIIGGQATDIEMEIAGKDLAELDRLAVEVKAVASDIDGLKDVDTTVRTGKGEFRIRPKRDVLADNHLGALQLGMALRANLEGVTAGTYKKDARNYDIVVRMAEREGTRQVEEFQFPAPGRPPVLLTGMATVEESKSSVQVTRKDKSRISKVLANLGSSLPLGTAVTLLNEAVDGGVTMPPGYSYGYTGVYEVMVEGQAGLMEAMLISVVLVVLTLAAILESFKQPIIILVTLPLALIGVFWALALTGAALDIFAIMGCVMMVGIVVNNAILIVDQFNVHVAEGTPRHKAMITATCERFRPVVMITLAAVLGMVPLAFGRGIGAELRNGVGIASIGGILVSGVLTIFVVPILYDLMTRKGGRKREA